LSLIAEATTKPYSKERTVSVSATTSDHGSWNALHTEASQSTANCTVSTYT